MKFSTIFASITVFIVVSSFFLTLTKTVNAYICGVPASGPCTNNSQCWDNPSSPTPDEQANAYCDYYYGAGNGRCNHKVYSCSVQALECGLKCGIQDGTQNYGYPGQPGSGGAGALPWQDEPTLSNLCSHFKSNWSWFQKEDESYEWRKWTYKTSGNCGGKPCQGAGPCDLGGTQRTYAVPVSLFTGFGANSCQTEDDDGVLQGENNRFITRSYNSFNPYLNYPGSPDPDEPYQWFALLGQNDAYDMCRQVIDAYPSIANCTLDNVNLTPTGAYYEDLVQMDVVWNVNYVDISNPPSNNMTNTTFAIDSFNASNTSLFISDLSGNIVGTGEESTDSSPIIFTAYGKGAGTKVGNETVNMDGLISNYGGQAMCNTSVNIPVGPPPAWWQVRGAADVVVGGNIQTQIPNGCTNRDPGSCRDEFIVEDPEGSGTPGVVVHGGTAVYEISPLSQGNANIKDWTANTLYSDNAKVYDYAHFDILASGKTLNSFADGKVIRTGDINGPIVDTDGFKWIKVNGNASTGNGGLNFSGTRKAIILVDGNLTINGTITINDPTNNFVMFIVKGNISINTSVGHPNPSDTPNLEGIYFTDGQFITNTGGAGNDRSLVIRGMVSALDGFSLDRDLGDDNLDSPAEMFIYAPEFMINFPTTLSDKHLTWQEVVP